MGRCHEFGSQIREGCGHPMRAGERACACPECGVVCHGQFDGCPDVWARGPRPVSLTAAPAISAPRVRALAAGPAPAQAGQDAPPAGSTTTNGNGNGAGATNGAGYAAAPPPPPASPPPPPRGPGPTDARVEILQWFEDAFDELRNELHALDSAVTRQQAMLAELLDSREAELRVVMVAESLPELVGEAAAKALNDQSDGLAEVVASSLDDFRAAVQASDSSSVAVMDGMRELLRRVEVTAEVNTEDARMEGAAQLESLKASVARQLRPLSAAIAELADYIDETEEREAARAKAIKASVTRQVGPLLAAVEAANERSDRQLAEIHARLDQLGAPKPPRKPAARKAPAPARAPRETPTAKAVAPTPRKPAAPRKAKAPAPAPAPAAPLLKAKPAPKPRPVLAPPPAPAAPTATAILYDYESPRTD